MHLDDSFRLKHLQCIPQRLHGNIQHLDQIALGEEGGGRNCAVEQPCQDLLIGLFAKAQRLGIVGIRFMSLDHPAIVLWRLFRYSR